MRLNAIVWVGDWVGVRRSLGHVAAGALVDGTDWPTIVQRFGSTLIGLDVEPDATVAEFARRALDASAADGQEVFRIKVENLLGETLSDDARLADAVEPDDLVLVKAEVPTDTDYSIVSLGRPEALFDALDVAAAVEVAAWPRLWGALLYTEEDAALATYVRLHFDELNALSGPLLRVFVVERPPDWRRALKYWRRHLEPELLRPLAALRWLSRAPYDKSGLYDVARELGVDPELFPCLVLFGGSDDRTIVFPIESADPASLRELFGTIQRVAGGEAPVDRTKAVAKLYRSVPLEADVRGVEALRALAASASWADREALARVSAVKDTLRATEFTGRRVVISHATVENVTFNGPTTFIHKPVDTVVADFQNTHASPYAERFAELLRLALHAGNALPEDRVLLARRVVEVAAKVESGGVAWQLTDVLRRLHSAAYRHGLPERFTEVLKSIEGSVATRNAEGEAPR
ncbi:hypothetical protein [Saccharothrix luteola]|uniref:hypothetical protein n=1 Tax=Saccharothrix luteola TaxID=2893018 RepID=UPI001E60560E|nr:hypothetical protein [Saccharothrix luteola]MCC8250203.1 hypothetical protein [Saccharothrix luteola]